MRELGELMVIPSLPDWLKPRLSFGIGTFFFLYFLVLHLGDRWADARVIEPWHLDPKAEAPNANVDGYYLFECIASGIFWMVMDGSLEAAAFIKECFDSRPYATQERQRLLAIYQPPADAIIIPVKYNTACRTLACDIFLNRVPVWFIKAVISVFSIAAAGVIPLLYDFYLNDYMSKDDDDPEPIVDMYKSADFACKVALNLILCGQFVAFIGNRIISSAIPIGNDASSHSSCRWQNLLDRVWDREKKAWSNLDTIDRWAGEALFSWPKRSSTLTLHRPLRVLPTETADEEGQLSSMGFSQL